MEEKTTRRHFSAFLVFLEKVRYFIYCVQYILVVMIETVLEQYL